LQNAGVGRELLAFLIHRGALAQTENGNYRMWHDRLLNWAVAQALFKSWRDGSKSDDNIVEHISHLWRDDSQRSRLLGYVPMDAIWLLVRQSTGFENILVRVFEAIERFHFRSGDEFYRQLLPPIGPLVAPSVFRRMEERAQVDQWDYMEPLADCVATFDASVILPHCLRLLSSGIYALLRSACQVIAKRPTKAVLEPLWTLLQDVHLNKEKYDKPDTSMAVAYYLESECFKALKACAMFDPEWVEEAILYRQTDSKSLMFLAYILPGLPDGEARSRRCQAKLQTHLEPQHLRAVAKLAYYHPEQNHSTCNTFAKNCVSV